MIIIEQTTTTITNGHYNEPHVEPDVYSMEAVDSDSARATDAFCELLEFMRPHDRIDVRQQATSLLAVLWAVNPELVGGRSLADIQRETGGLIDRRQLSRVAIRFSNCFGFRSSGQRPRPPHPR